MASTRRLLADRVDLVLRGHLHQTEVGEWIDPDRRLRELAVGSLYEGGLADTYGNSCQLVRLELDSKGRPIEAVARFRSFSLRRRRPLVRRQLPATAKARRDASPGPSARRSQGSRTLSAPGRHARPLLRTRRPDSPPRNAFDERRSVWLVGDWRIGKTTLLLGVGEAAARARSCREARIRPGCRRCFSAPGLSRRSPVWTRPTTLTEPADRLTTWIEAVSSSGLPPVVLVDEVESVVQTCDERFFERLRDLLGTALSRVLLT